MCHEQRDSKMGVSFEAPTVAYCLPHSLKRLRLPVPRSIHHWLKDVPVVYV